MSSEEITNWLSQVFETPEDRAYFLQMTARALRRSPEFRIETGNVHNGKSMLMEMINETSKDESKEI